ncbi:gamma-glutamyltransferase [Candidatus Rariloculus sp.]|uniref:gamma-glutamyltransferase n=1 Tax=Candidatus Rariloculus sp. TaxID=3101265 RepID=UPI003D14CD52
MTVLLRRALILACSFAVTCAWLARASAAEPVRATEQMVVAANPYAAEAGIGILRGGGSAVDAAIAVQLVLSLVEPQSSGIGGGAFMLVFDAPDDQPSSARRSSAPPGQAADIIAYEGRETAPAAATPDMFLDDNGRAASFPAVAFGGLSVGVPGAMRMLELAHRDHGRLPWPDLFAPALDLAERGFEVSPRLHFLLDRFNDVARGERFRAYFYDDDGEPREPGFRLVNTEYAATLRTLAAQGADAMYTGELADRIVDTVRNDTMRAGRMTHEDLRAYEARTTTPLCSPYRQWRVCGPRLPSSGGVTVQQILGILQAFDLPAIAGDPVQSVHLIADASRLAFADRNFYLGDPDFVAAPVAALLSGEYLRGRAALIDRRRALESVSPGSPQPDLAWNFAPSEPTEVASTSHFSIGDRWGDAVSMTTSVQGAFGSQLMTGGFILNNQLTDFSFAPEIDGKPVANRAEPRKRPLSSMTPSVVLDADGRLRLIVGSPGGTRIINFVAQAIVAVLDWELNIQDAVAAPHFVAQGRSIELERGTDILDHAEQLRALGHNVVSRNLNSGLHGMTVDYTDGGRVLSGGADPRREGVALGD